VPTTELDLLALSSEAPKRKPTSTLLHQI